MYLTHGWQTQCGQVKNGQRTHAMCCVWLPDANSGGTAVSMCAWCGASAECNAVGMLRAGMTDTGARAAGTWDAIVGMV